MAIADDGRFCPRHNREVNTPGFVTLPCRAGKASDPDRHICIAVGQRPCAMLSATSWLTTPCTVIRLRGTPSISYVECSEYVTNPRSNALLKPSISVSSEETSPPVQLSAVAMLNPALAIFCMAARACRSSLSASVRSQRTGGKRTSRTLHGCSRKQEPVSLNFTRFPCREGSHSIF